MLDYRMSLVCTRLVGLLACRDLSRFQYRVSGVRACRCGPGNRLGCYAALCDSCVSNIADVWATRFRDVKGGEYRARLGGNLRGAGGI